MTAWSIFADALALRIALGYAGWNSRWNCTSCVLHVWIHFDLVAKVRPVSRYSSSISKQSKQHNPLCTTNWHGHTLYRSQKPCPEFSGALTSKFLPQSYVLFLLPLLPGALCCPQLRRNFNESRWANWCVSLPLLDSPTNSLDQCAVRAHLLSSTISCCLASLKRCRWLFAGVGPSVFEQLALMALMLKL